MSPDNNFPLVALSAAAAGFLAASAARAEAHASPLPARIEWDAPAGCPDVGRVRAAVESMVSAPSLRRDASELVVRAAVSQAGIGRFTMRMQIETSGASEVKTIDADTCATLADALAVVVAFTLDPSAGARIARAREALPAGATVAEERAAPSSDRTASQPARESKSRGLRVGAGIGPLAAVGAGLLPFPAYGIGARITLQAGVRAELAGVVWPEQPTTVAVDPTLSAGARVSLESVQPSVCVPLGAGVTAVCAGAEVGAMHASGTQVLHPGNGTSWWVALSAGFAARARLGSAIDLRFRVDAGVPLLRPSFVLQQVAGHDSIEAFRPAPVFGVVSLEPEFRFLSTDSPEAGHVHH